MEETIIDTNIFRYRIGKTDQKKVSPLLINSNKNNGVISTQVLQEFYIASTKKSGAELFAIR